MDLILKQRHRDGFNLADDERSVCYNAGNGREAMGMEMLEGFEVGLYSCTSGTIGSGDGKCDGWLSGHKSDGGE